MRGRWSGRLVGAVVVVALAAVVIWRVVQGTRPPEAVPTVEELRESRGIPVTVAPASAGRLEVWQRHDGTVGGVRDAVVRARTSDEVVEVRVAVGDRVRAGEVVVTQRGAGVDARVRQAEVQLRQARNEAQRARTLHEAGAASAQAREAAEAQLGVARAALDAARGERELRAPLDGVVTELPARPGMIPDAEEPLVRISDLTALVVRSRVPAADAARIRSGQPARIPGGAGGEVRRVALGADPVTRLVEVEIAFPPDAGLVVGTLVAVELRVAEREETVHVPRGAVRDGVVWVTDGEGRASRREVEVGLRGGDRIEIARGVEPGEQVVVEGASLLRDGARVRLVGEDGRAEER